MRAVRNVAKVLAVLCLLPGFFGCECVTAPPTPEKIEAINNSDVYKLAQEALQPIADQFVERGDRILLANMPAFYGSDAWRFVPVPLEVKQEDFEGIIQPNARKLFKPSASDPLGMPPEVKLLSDVFTLDATRKVYTLKTSGDKYNELLLGRTLAGAGYSGIGTFSLVGFATANPYFIDSFESGLLAAVLKKQGKGFERLWTAAMDATDVPLGSQKRLADHQTGKLVFNTNMLDFNTWADVQDTYKPNSITKALLYSINNVVSSRMDYIGMQVSFRLVDVAGGKVLWSGAKTLTSDAFPKDKIPYLGTVRLTIPAQSVSAQKDAIVKTLKDQGVRTMNAVLVKIDDIPVFGSYPVTREDFAVENSLADFFASLQLSTAQSVTVMEKLYPRQYKEAWQLAHAVHYVNPVLGGDYGQLKNYYGAQYMIGYRVMWKKIQGVQILQGDKDLELSGKILGIYVKIMDMADSGRVVLSTFLSLGSDAELDQNVLYRCFARTRSFSALAESLRDSGVITEATHTSLINRRMEIANNYISEKTADKTEPEKFLLDRLPQWGDQGALMMNYYDAYENLRTFGQTPEQAASVAPKASSADGTTKEETWTPAQELNMTVAINLMQTWFEDGLCTALAAGNVAPNEKLESLYSRYLLQKSVNFARIGSNTPEEMLYLSPLLLSKWGSTAPLKSYYGIDKIIYFSLLETGIPTTAYVKPPSSTALSRFFPLVASDPDSLQISVVNVVSGDYEFKQDFALK